MESLNNMATGEIIVKNRNKNSLLNNIIKNRFLYLLLIPSFAFLFLFKYYPVFIAVYRSFFDWNGGAEATFVGFDNFIRIFKDKAFLQSVKNMLVYAILIVPLTVSMPFITAEILVNLKSKRAFGFYRGAFLMPMVVPVIITYLMWKFMYNPQLGAINKILEALGLEAWKQNWLGNPDIAIFSVIFTAAPFIIPLRLLIFIAGLQNIPSELYESAMIEGATRLYTIFKIDIPLSLSQFKLTFILSTLAILESFENIFVMTGGGPSDSTINPALYMYKTGSEYLEVGYSSAIGMVIFFAVLIITILNNKYVKSETDFDAT